MQQRVSQARERFTALETKFLADGRAVLTTTEQLQAWDLCASSVDLSPASTKSALDEAFLDPDAGPAVGETAPDFSLRDVNGAAVSLSSLRGRPVVIQFGSYTCPAFREQASQLQPVVDGYGGKVAFVVVYGHEAHPTDGWVSQVNVREGIAIPSHQTWEDRQKAALTARDALGIRGTILVDEVPDKTVEAWGGHPNTGYVLDANGVVASRQPFVSATEVKSVLDSLVKR